MAATWRLLVSVVVLSTAACSGSVTSAESSRGTESAAASPEVGPTLDLDAAPVIDSCQPWPDRPFELFLGAYASGNSERMDAVAGGASVTDPVALAYAGNAGFGDAVGWAEQGWEVADEVDMAGYNPGFDSTAYGEAVDVDEGAVAILYASRTNDRLTAVGIEQVGATYAITIDDDCHVVEVQAVGEVWSQPRPCDFAREFLDEGQRERWSPGCDDGTRAAARTAHHTLQVGDRLAVLGGTLGGHFRDAERQDGLLYDPEEVRWSELAWPAPSLERLDGAWSTSDGILALGRDSRDSDGARQLWSWTASEGWVARPSPPDDLPPATLGIWDGRRLVLWGGYRDSSNAKERPVIFDTQTDSWHAGSPAPTGRRWWHTTVWTGTEMIAWGGSDARTDLATGAAYDPGTDQWRMTEPAPVAPRQWHTAVWTGTEMIVWGGSSISTSRADGAAYDPATDQWRELTPAPLAPRHHHTAVWTGTELIIWGGTNYTSGLADGAAYDPATDSWRTLPDAPLDGRCDHTATWTGTAMIIFGGRSCSDVPGAAFGDGALYRPQANEWTPLPLPPE